MNKYGIIFQFELWKNVGIYLQLILKYFKIKILFRPAIRRIYELCWQLLIQACIFLVNCLFHADILRNTKSIL